jgi:dephospho-CoA kinase
MIVGLTGGIGSGKTTVGEIFKTLGIPVFVADEQAKVLLDTDLELQKKLVKLLGEDLLENGKVNRAFMARLIFDSDELLNKVNNLVHPAVAKTFAHWYQQQKAPYVLREAAILFETGTHQDCDKIVVVTASQELRLERVISRSGEKAAQVKARMAKQWPQEKKDALADYLIDNNGQQSLIEQVLKVHENIISQTN